MCEFSRRRRSGSFAPGGSSGKKTISRPISGRANPRATWETYGRELRDVFARNLPRYFAGPERIGISLTGGLDTRMIMAWHRPSPESLPCYTFGGTYRSCRDVVVGREVARAAGQSHGVIGVGEDFLSRFSRYAERTVYLTDGCADVSRSADLYVNEFAREIAPVRMTGNYGGEVLRRVRAFKPVVPVAGLFAEESAVARSDRQRDLPGDDSRAPAVVFPPSGRCRGITMDCSHSKRRRWRFDRRF